VHDDIDGSPPTRQQLQTLALVVDERHHHVTSLGGRPFDNISGLFRWLTHVHFGILCRQISFSRRAK
jgi:hypothetical protein